MTYVTTARTQTPRAENFLHLIYAHAKITTLNHLIFLKTTYKHISHWRSKFEVHFVTRALLINNNAASYTLEWINAKG